MGPVGTCFTRAQWANDLLTALGEPKTSANIEALVAWSIAEGGAHQNGAMWNPLNTKRDEPGSWWIFGKGAKAYPDYKTGLKATIDTLHNGLYGRILYALHTGTDPQAVIDAAIKSSWAESKYSRDDWLSIRTTARQQIVTAHC